MIAIPFFQKWFLRQQWDKIEKLRNEAAVLASKGCGHAEAAEVLAQQGDQSAAANEQKKAKEYQSAANIKGIEASILEATYFPMDISE